MGTSNERKKSLPKSVKIRDPVYNYIYVTPIEANIIDRPEVQRLRFILQNSSAYLTYPSNNSSRFSHSLGVMHLAGELFINGLKQSRNSDLDEFLTGVYKYIKKYALGGLSEGELLIGWKETLGDAASFAHHPNKGPALVLTEEQRLTVNLLWQAVRLAALLHDVGHFPLSHLFEDAYIDFFTFATGDKKGREPFDLEYLTQLKDFQASLPDHIKQELPIRKRPVVGKLLKEYPLHEMWGAILFDKWLAEDIKYVPHRCFYNVAFHLAKVVSLVKSEPRHKRTDAVGIFRCLHGLVSGELDADRLDYSVRDPQSSGLELGAIDVARIVRSMTLVKVNRRFVILPDASALSALESFFHQRYLTYRYLVYHHNVVRLDGVAREIIFRLLREAARPADSHNVLEDIFDRFGLGANRQGEHGFLFLRHGFEYYDDAWLRTLMSQCLFKLRKEMDLAPRFLPLILLLETFLYRKSHNLLSMWKREPDYCKSIEKVIGSLKTKGIKAKDDLRKEIRKILSPKAEVASFEREVIRPIKKELEEKGIVVISRIMKPKVPAPLKVLVADSPEDCREMSSYLKLLAENESAPTVFIGFVGRDLKSEDNEKLRTMCHSTVMKHLTSHVKARLPKATRAPDMT